MKTLTLDINKWRCGSNGLEGVTALRGGQQTYLLNTSGYMCCLGQFTLQLGVSKSEIRNKQNPYDVDRKIPILTKKSYCPISGHIIVDTIFSNEAVDINDNKSTPIAKKVKLLKALCSKYKIKLKVKGKIPKPA